MNTDLLLPMAYGTKEEEHEMRLWLDAPALPSNVGNFFLSMGICSMDEVRMLSALGDPASYQVVEKQMTTNAVSSETNSDTSESTKKRRSK